MSDWSDNPLDTYFGNFLVNCHAASRFRASD